MYHLKIVQGKPLLPPSTAKVPEYILHLEYPFENVRLDYAGSIYTRYFQKE